MKQGDTSETAAFVPAPLASTDAVERLAAEMAAAWRRGERRAAEHYLDHHPELRDAPEGAVRLIYEEVCLRQEQGEEVAAAELLRRFPRWADELAVMLDCHRLVRAHLAPPLFPAAGESLGDFRLLAELGRGRHARVFLATQPTLADRPVVLKVTPRRDREFLSLARLQHTHVIPLHGAYDFPARNLRALCQPYLGGATLARLLELLRPVPAECRTGRSLLDALDRAGREAPLRLPGRGGSREALARATYSEAVCWVGACLADGLQYAHERDLVHLDLKPSNVLLAADAQPLLLDFHLALHPLPAGRTAPEGFGGTPQYMSPEQEEACAAAREGKPVPRAVDHRSDLYSLGRLLYAALADEDAPAGRPLQPLHRRNPQVSVGLSDLIHKCLAANPEDRYGSAAALAADLRRHLAHLPLRGVPTRSLRERWRKWRQRRPNAPLWAALLLALATGAAALVAGTVERHQDARRALADGQSQLQRGAYREAIATLARGRARADGLLGSSRLVQEIDAQLRRARRARAAQDLHMAADSLRFLAGADMPAPAGNEVLEAHCRRSWDERRLLADRAAELDADTEARLRDDLLDLALLWSDLKGREGAAGRAEGRTILAEAEELLGPSSPREREREAWWRHITLGRALLRSGDLGRAAEELEAAIDQRPENFWANFYRGVCAFRRGQHAAAVQSFGVAVALAPASAESYYNRGRAYAAWGKDGPALRDYDRALALAPHLGAAALSRGVLNHRAGRYAQARADLEQALRDGADPASAHYNLALVHLALRDEPAARGHLERALGHNPAHPEARLLQERLRQPQ